MHTLTGWRVPLFVALVIGMVILLQTPAVAQCSMCKAVLSGSNNARFIRNFNIGVLVLLLPPVSIFCSIFIVLKRHGAKDQESERDTLDSRADSDS